MSTQLKRRQAGRCVMLEIALCAFLLALISLVLRVPFDLEASGAGDWLGILSSVRGFPRDVWLNSLFALFSIAAVSLLAYELSGGAVSVVVAAIFLAVHPLHVLFSRLAADDLTALILICLAAVQGLRACKSRESSASVICMSISCVLLLVLFCLIAAGEGVLRGYMPPCAAVFCIILPFWVSRSSAPGVSSGRIRRGVLQISRLQPQILSGVVLLLAGEAIYVLCFRRELAPTSLSLVFISYVLPLIVPYLLTITLRSSAVGPALCGAAFSLNVLLLFRLVLGGKVLFDAGQAQQFAQDLIPWAICCGAVCLQAQVGQWRLGKCYLLLIVMSGVAYWGFFSMLPQRNVEFNDKLHAIDRIAQSAGARGAVVLLVRSPVIMKEVAARLKTRRGLTIANARNERDVWPLVASFAQQYKRVLLITSEAMAVSNSVFVETINYNRGVFGCTLNANGRYLCPQFAGFGAAARQKPLYVYQVLGTS